MLYFTVVLLIKNATFHSMLEALELSWETLPKVYTQVCLHTKSNLCPHALDFFHSEIPPVCKESTAAEAPTQALLQSTRNGEGYSLPSST